MVAENDLAREIDGLVQKCAWLGFSGSVLVAKNGEILVARGVGSADLEGQTPNTANTLHELASVTKQFTAAAICRLVELKKLQLDDRISRHLPDIPMDCEAITLRHLLNHTSGIPGTNSTGGGTDIEKVIPFFFRGGPQHTPGTHFEYWNQGYALLSAIVERKSDSSLAEFCSAHLFEPAGMTTACFTGDAIPKGASVAIGRSQRGAPRSALAHPYGSYGYQYRGMGGAVSNVHDLWRWHRALQGTEVLSQASKEELFKPSLNDYALGWFVRKTRGRLVHSHSGVVRGFSCQVRRYPSEDACVFVLANDDAAPARAVADLLEKALFGEKYTAPSQPLSLAMQKAIIGTYKTTKGQRLVLAAQGAVTRALLHWPAASGYPPSRGSIAMNGDSWLFVGLSSTITLKIQKDDEGKVFGIHMDSMHFTR